MPDETAGQDRMAALERFVVENDELLALEERIGRFNIFDALGIAKAEVRHSNFLAWLLDPAESHGQAALFLNAILMDLLRQSPVELRPLSPVEIDGEEMRGVEIRREWRHLDLLITCKQPAFVIAIENKVGSSEHSDQLARYERVVQDHFPNLPVMFVYLTIDKDEPSSERWVPYTYADIYRVLTRVRNTNASAVGDDVLAFLDHYLRLIGSRFMNDSKIDELCQRIYRNHRQALDLIYERVGSPAASLLAEFEDLITQHSGDWHVFNKTTKRVEFIPKSWFELLPPVGKRPRFDPRIWFALRFEIHKARLTFTPRIYPTEDASIRQQVIDRLTADPDEFGFRLLLKKAGAHSTSLGTTVITTWKEEEGPNEEAVCAAAKKKLDQLQKRLAGVPEVLAPVIGQWSKEAGMAPATVKEKAL